MGLWVKGIDDFYSYTFSVPLKLFQNKGLRASIMQPYLYEYKYFTTYFKDRILKNLSNIKADCTCIEICVYREAKRFLWRETGTNS